MAPNRRNNQNQRNRGRNQQSQRNRGQNQQNPRSRAPNQVNLRTGRFAQYSSENRALPTFEIRNEVVKKIKRHDTIILIGETGCGKSTQLPQYVLDCGLHRSGCIAVSQPRRIAAISISQRVAEERNEICGQTVGYKVRFENNISPNTKLIYATDGMLVREAINDKLLSRYNIIFLDEVHERTITNDILMGIAQNAQELRRGGDNPLKIIVMSAALDVDHFQEYFNGARIWYIEGRCHQVRLCIPNDDIDDYYYHTKRTVLRVHHDRPVDGDILVFLTGREEIERMASELRSAPNEDPTLTAGPIEVHTLYSAVRSQNQLAVFEPAPSGTRKIIIATNIAETSITIPGIKYVIDCGKVKKKSYNPTTGVSMLKVENISKAQAIQRKGRAGRICEGYCYRIYSDAQCARMSKNIDPEIRRSNLNNVVLMLIAMKENPRTFNFMDKPEKESIEKALEELQELGAITDLREPILNDCGLKMSSLPIDPKYSKVLLRASAFNCVADAMDIIAMLTADNIFIDNYSTDENIREIRRRFVTPAGDHIALLTIFRKFKKTKDKEDWCSQNHLNFRALKFAMDVKDQLRTLYGTIFPHVPTSSSAPTFVNARKVLLTGLFRNVAFRQSDKTYRTVISNQRTLIHPSSVLSDLNPSCVLFTELMETSDLYMKNVTRIEPDWLNEYVPESVRSQASYFSSANPDFFYGSSYSIVA